MAFITDLPYCIGLFHFTHLHLSMTASLCKVQDYPSHPCGKKSTVPATWYTFSKGLWNNCWKMTYYSVMFLFARCSLICAFQWSQWSFDHDNLSKGETTMPVYRYDNCNSKKSVTRQDQQFIDVWNEPMSPDSSSLGLLDVEHALVKLHCYTHFIQKAYFPVCSQLLIQSKFLCFSVVFPEKGVAGEFKVIQHKPRLKYCNRSRPVIYFFKIRTEA